MTPTRAYLKAVNVAAQAFLRTVSKVVGGEVAAGRHRLLPGLRRHGAGLPRPGRAGARSCSPRRTRPTCSWPRPARDTVEEASFFADKLAEDDVPVAALDREPHAPDVRAGSAAERRPPRPRQYAGTPLGRPVGQPRRLPPGRRAGGGALGGPGRAGRAGAGRQVPFLRSDVHDLDGLAAIGAHLFASAPAI